MTYHEGVEALAPGTVLAGRYRLDVKLGEGGMGMVWAATHVVTRQPVALKLLLPVTGSDGPRVIKRFMREARAASAVKHPNVVVVYDVMELDAETPMMVMELLRGETLGERLHRERRLPLGELARLLLPVVSALGTAHALGIVHRDIKPDNIFLATTPEGICVKVLDFGIAKLSPAHEDAATTGTLTATNAIVGTPYYMAPEQIFGEKDIDHRADTWALGVIAYECLAGLRPTDASNVGQVMKIIATQRITPIDQTVRDVPADVAAIIMAALSAERNERPSLHDVMTVFGRYTDVHVRDFAEPQAPLTSGSSLPSGESTGPNAPVASDPSLGTAPTVASGERVPTSPTAATLEAGVTQLDATQPMPARKPSRWLTLALGLGLVAATSALTVSLVSRPRAASSPAPPPSTTPSAAPVAETASVAKERETIQPDAAASVAAPATTYSSHVKPSASATAPPKRPSAPDHGGVVETVPY